MKEPIMMENRRKVKKFLIGMLTGTITGALLALLYAPKSGKKLRRDIGRKKDELIDNAEDYLDSAKLKASEIIAESRKKAETMISEAKKKAGGITKNLHLS